MAISKPWGFTLNPFLNATINSYRLAVRISNYHLGAISKKAGDPVFDAMTASYMPIHGRLEKAYKKWIAQAGSQQGKTLLLTQLLKLLSSNKIKDWDIAIQQVFRNTTPEYKAILPNNRSPFQTGSQEDRISAVAALSESLAGIASLAAVLAEVDAFADELKTVVLLQKGDIAATKSSSDEVEAARIAMCEAQYANLGGLIQLFAATPRNIDQYFDLAAIRSGAQLVFTGDTKPGEHENIFKHTFQPAEKLLLKNEGITDLIFYLAPVKKDATAAVIIKLSAGTQQTIGTADLGNISNTFFNILNPDENSVGEWTVEFI